MLYILAALNFLVAIGGGILIAAVPGTFIPATVLVGLFLGASGIILAHELIHSRKRMMRWTGWSLMTLVSQIWWVTEHNRFHHRLVGTPEDAATARYGESVYKFLPRLFWTSLRHVWQASKPIWACSFIMPLCLACALWYFSPRVAIYFLATGTIAGLLLGVVNYIEHYGVMRKPRARIEAKHSWAATMSSLGNKALLSLPFHADHHLHPSRPWQELEDIKESPRLPGDYWQMILLALYPRKWFLTIHPILLRNLSR
jgi:alkane 1-monooxygenase